MTALVTDHLPATLPRYLMGVGTPIDLLESVHRGVDMFDCIAPLQVAQRGLAFTSHGKLQLRRSVYKFSTEALDTQCPCQTCKHYSRGYLHHLIKTEEILGWHLVGLHNLTFYHRLMQEMREHILNNDFLSYYKTQRTELVRIDEENPTRPPKKTKMPRPTRLGDYEIHQSAQGFCSLRQLSSGEVMHSVNAPSEEANRLYIEQSCLAERLLASHSDSRERRNNSPHLPGNRAFTQQHISADSITIWDVGLGA